MAKRPLQGGGIDWQLPKRHVHFDIPHGAPGELARPAPAGADRIRFNHDRARIGNQEGIPVAGFELVKRLSTGGMSEAINVVREKKTGKVFVEKRVLLQGVRRSRAVAELKTLRRIQGSKNLNDMVTHLWNEQMRFCSFILKYCDRGTLDAVIGRSLKTGSRLPEDLMWHVLVGMAKGLSYLHHGIRDSSRDRADGRWNSICHLDIKPCNVFLSSKGQEGRYPRVVIGDFGCAITISDIISGKVSWGSALLP